MNLLDLHYLVLLDAAAAVLFLVFAALSRKLGEALKTPSYFYFLHVAAMLVAAAALADIMTASRILSLPGVLSMIPLSLRAVAGLLAVSTALRYWKWLFPEFFHD